MMGRLMITFLYTGKKTGKASGGLQDSKPKE